MRLATPTIGFAALLAGALLVGSAPAGLSAAAVSTCTPPPAAPDPALPAPRPAVVSYPVPSSTGVSKTAATLLATVDTGGSAGQVAFELGDATAGLRCTAVQLLAAVTGPQPVTVKLRSEKPGATVHFRLVVSTAAGQVVGADQAFTTVANPTRLAPGTTMLGIRVGYLTPEQARARVLARFARPVVFSWHGKRWQATPKQLGATVDVDGALDRALAGVGGGGTIPVTITVDPAKVERYVDYLDSLYARPAQVGSVTRAGRKAKLVEPLTARAVQKQRMETLITRTLKSATRPPIELLVSETKPGGPGQLFIVVRLEEQSLTLYKDGAVVLRTPVTTGRPALPTPVGSYDIAWRRSPYTFISPWPEGNPYYYPPAHVRWAMYFFDNDFLHDSYEPAGAYGKGSNYGPYASHGCVHVPAGVMQVLYTTVPDHTPLIVVDS
jgi:lipoprotein-anchoring transpeptidase ErfK/SrfK